MHSARRASQYHAPPSRTYARGQPTNLSTQCTGSYTSATWHRILSSSPPSCGAALRTASSTASSPLSFSPALATAASSASGVSASGLYRPAAMSSYRLACFCCRLVASSSLYLAASAPASSALSASSRSRSTWQLCAACVAASCSAARCCSSSARRASVADSSFSVSFTLRLRSPTALSSCPRVSASAPAVPLPALPCVVLARATVARPFMAINSRLDSARSRSAMSLSCSRMSSAWRSCMRWISRFISPTTSCPTLGSSTSFISFSSMILRSHSMACRSTSTISASTSRLVLRPSSI
mmetsp:Transcript_8015/g.20049  ORF Transcript_8015/g.20049 Transcript_8015/m.20049 type:complete len:298 (-) Transcript_8015:1047-1940(-)